MINLIPTNEKQSNTYGIKNRMLIRWCIAFMVGVLGIWVIVGFGYVQLNNSINAQQQQVANAEQRLKDQDIEGVRDQTESIDSSIKLALQVLEQKLLFSELIQRIGSVIPENAILQDISLQEFEGAINLTARAADYQSATQVQVNIADPSNNVFAQADILNIDCISDAEPGTLDARYPCTVNLRALFGDNSPFLFVNQSSEVATDE
jgi:Tfp pilus assembly protein PilN